MTFPSYAALLFWDVKVTNSVTLLPFCECTEVTPPMDMALKVFLSLEWELGGSGSSLPTPCGRLVAPRPADRNVHTLNTSATGPQTVGLQPDLLKLPRNPNTSKPRREVWVETGSRSRHPRNSSRSLLHCDLTETRRVKQGSNLTVWHVYVHLFQYHLSKGLLLLNPMPGARGRPVSHRPLPQEAFLPT